jgi:hypothetical protein
MVSEIISARYRMTVRIFFFYLFSCLLPFAAATAATAAGLEPLNLIARYDFDWNGIALGRITVVSEETPAHYKFHAWVASRGVVSVFASHRSDTVVEGRQASGRYFAQTYETRYRTRKKAKHVKITYDGAGHVKDQLLEPPDSDASKVTQAEKDKAYDTLTTVMEIRRHLYDAMREKKTAYDFDMYDGRRISHLHFLVAGRKHVKINGKARDVLAVTASREPGTGYSEKEIGRMKDEPAMSIYFSDDAVMMPLGIEINYLGTIRGELSKECKTAEECM